jgi:NitT/TauT family transport system substrate-binding protein
VKRYYDQDSWPADLVFKKESFELLQHILMEAGELDVMQPYEALVNTEFAKKAAEK